MFLHFFGLTAPQANSRIPEHHRGPPNVSTQRISLHTCSTPWPRKGQQTSSCFAHSMQRPATFISGMPMPFKVQRGIITCLWLHRVHGCSNLRSSKQTTKYTEMHWSPTCRKTKEAALQKKAGSCASSPGCSQLIPTPNTHVEP